LPERLVNPAILGVTLEFLRLPAKPTELVLHMIVPKSDKVHFTASGECYKRHGAQNLRIREKDIDRLLFTKGQQSFEDMFVDTVSADDLKRSTYLKQYMSLVPTAQPATMFLRKQRLIDFASGRALRNTRVRTAAVLLFDDEPQAALPTRAGVKITRYQTTQSDYDRKLLVGSPDSIEGPTDLLIRRAVAKVEDIMNSSYFRISGRYDKVKYPPAAIHEIVANAVLHRDYNIKDDVHVSIYDNRIEVTSPGRLPGHITPQNILEERFMRNPKIVRLVNKLPDPPNKDIGEGLNTAFREMQKARLKRHIIEELDAAVRVTLLHETLASPEQQIVEHLRAHHQIQNKQARAITGNESSQAIYKVFTRLIAAGIIEVIDPVSSVYQREYRLTADWQANWTQGNRRKRKKKEE
jgi:ATP-dependent DNA helicase RecG